MSQFLIGFFTIILATVELFAQDIDCSDTTLAKSEFTFTGIYGLADFKAPDPEVSTHFSELIVQFDSTNFFHANAANSESGYYSIHDSDSIGFYCIMSTTVFVEVTTKSGYEYGGDIYFDTLVNCNKFRKVDDEIRFYRDSEFKLALKPYFDLLGFPRRENTINKKDVVPIKIDSLDIKLPKGYLIVNSVKQANSADINITGINIDFENSSLIIVENKPLQNLKQKNLKNLIKNTKKQNCVPFYPVSYAKIYQNTDSKFYLDIVNTYFSSLWGGWKLRGRFTGFVVDKVNDGNLILTVKYVK